MSSWFVPMPAYKPLPDEVQAMCRTLEAPPRLVAHLTLVHDCAYQLVAKLNVAFPDLRLDGRAVLFGAATHDIGKVVHKEELSMPGRKHEAAGVELLEKLGVPAQDARFAWTHGNWEGNQGLLLEDLIVALADKCWRGKRLQELEQQTAKMISEQTAKPEWEVYAALDDILQQLASKADERLRWQAEFPVSSGP